MEKHPLHSMDRQRGGLQVLDWLSHVGAKADHPMYNAEEARKLLRDLPADQRKALEEAASWLETVTTAEGYAPDDRIGVVKLLDETGQVYEPVVLDEFLRQAGLKEFDRLKLWQTVVSFWERVAGASSYRMTLSDQDMIWPLARREAAGTQVFFSTPERRAWSAPRRTRD